MGIFRRSVISRRDDAALPHEDLADIQYEGEPEQHSYDDGADGNSTPNGGPLMATRDQMVSWAKSQTRNFSQLCQAWSWQVANHFGKAPVVYSSAYAAYRASKIVSRDATKAPGGVYHYWALSNYGHVAPGTGPDECLMATAHRGSAFTVVNAKSNLALVGVRAYNTSDYLGWSHTNGKNSFSFTTPKPAVVKHVGVPKTSTSVTGSPGKQPSNAWKRVQILATAGGYPGPIDGKLPDGGQSYKGLQTYLKRAGFYAGDVDGKPRKLTVTALQRWAGVKNPTVTDSLTRISRANWRKIATKLNTL